MPALPIYRSFACETAALVTPSARMKSALAGFVKSNRECAQFFARGQRTNKAAIQWISLWALYNILPLYKIRAPPGLLELSAILHAETMMGTRLPMSSDALALARSREAELRGFSHFCALGSVASAVTALEADCDRTALPPESLSDLLRPSKNGGQRCACEGFNLAWRRSGQPRWRCWNAAKLPATLMAPDVYRPSANSRSDGLRVCKGGHLRKNTITLKKLSRHSWPFAKEPFAPIV